MQQLGRRAVAPVGTSAKPSVSSAWTSILSGRAAQLTSFLDLQVSVPHAPKNASARKVGGVAELSVKCMQAHTYL